MFLVGGYRATAIPWTRGGRLAPGMRQLHTDRHVRAAPHRAQHLAQGGFGGVVPETEIGPADARTRLDRGRFDDQQPGAGLRQLAQMDRVPISGLPVFGRVLAHRRDDDAVGKGKRA